MSRRQEPPRETNLGTENICQRCRREEATEVFRNCGHRLFCDLCCQLYIDSNWPLNVAICPLCRTEVYTITSIRHPQLYYTPGLGYCDREHLLGRIFVAPGGILWRYSTYRPAGAFLDSIQQVISIECGENREREINWRNTHTEHRLEEFRIDYWFEEDHIRRQRIPQSRVRRGGVHRRAREFLEGLRR